MLPPEGTVYNFHRLAEGDVKQVEQPEEQEHDADSLCLGSPFQGWLAYIQPKDCEIFLFNPLSGKSFKLPSVETLPYVTGTVKSSTGLVESFLNFASLPVTPQHLSTCIIRKIVLSSSPMDDDCIALVIYGHLEQLAFCRINRPSDDGSYRWIDLEEGLGPYTQIVFDSWKKLFFSFTLARELEAWDLHSDPIRRFPIHGEDLGGHSWPIPSANDEELERKSEYCWDDDYLVYDHQSHQLFIVTRYTVAGLQQDWTLIDPDEDLADEFPYITLTFDVFKLQFIDRDHVELQYLENEEGSLGNRAFFIGSNPGFALSTTQFPELRHNSIYFTDDQIREKDNFGGHDLGIFDYKEERFLPCYYTGDPFKRIQPAPTWFTPDADA